MSFLSRIDWFNHDGVNLGMINDFMRNQFYDRILSRYVANQRCTDIGFGTGLLSMLALKHGAEHVQAFESDLDRYQLGCEIIKQLKLQDRIELINERYDHNYNPRSVTFTETVNGNLWWEGLWNSLPRGHETVFLPGTYFLEMWAVEIPASFAKGLGVQEQTNRVFAPGVDVDPAFVQTVNELICETADCVFNPMILDKLTPGIMQFDRQVGTVWNWIPYMRAVQAGSVVASYSATQWDEDRESFTLDVDTKDWRDKTVLIVPRLGMAQDNDRLYLDTGHWGPGENPIILSNPQTNLVVEHSVKTGLITYSLEQLKC
jgi:16S rRNA G966 N2-methylase RsmD